MKEYLSSFLVLEGYAKASTNREQFDVFLKKETGHVTVLFVLEQTGVRLTKEGVFDYRRKALEILEKKNLPEIHSLYLILTDRPDEAEAVTFGDYYIWVMDVSNRRLIIPPDRVPDFYGMKGRLEAFLSNPAKADTLLKNMQGQLENTIRAQEKKENEKIRQSIPYVTIGLIALNVLIGILELVFREYLVDMLSLDPVAIFENNEWYRLFTYIFVHGSLDHIINNMIMLYLEGNMLEKGIGRWRFALIYVLLGMLAGLGSLFFKVYTGSSVPSIGASGAIMGLMGIILFIGLKSIRTLRRGAWYRLFGLIVCAFYNIYEGFTTEGVDNAAHIAGMLAGLLIGVIWDLLSRRKRRKSGKE
ncbi:MAG: rhomboid family intramembrane serine protease [Lachnospiraceae bacterium]|nr:rhomboid family intramembrane serine protease [Lachnospiraceae bacterium]